MRSIISFTCPMLLTAACLLGSMFFVVLETKQGRTA